MEEDEVRDIVKVDSQLGGAVCNRDGRAFNRQMRVVGRCWSEWYGT